MKRRICMSLLTMPVVFGVSLALAGCVSNQSPQSVSGAPAAGASVAGAGGTRVATRLPGGPNVAAETICVMAVQQATNALDVAIIGSEAASADVQPGGTLVMVGFPAARAPWRCVTNAEGRVTEVGATSG